MPRTSERGGPQTRARIAGIASGLFAERGFDAVTVADVAREAGVSSVTVFKHFPRKEDLYLDRSADAEAVLRAAVRDRAGGTGVLASLREATLRLVEERHPLSGLDARSVPFFRTVGGSAALVARARELAGELQQGLADDLDADAEFDGDAALFAAMFIGGYAVLLVDAARRLIAGEPADDVAAAQRARMSALFDLLARGFGDDV
ncbi:helix-turn-helix domain-containing protein [Leifsonia sp. 1010]|uniref:TetR/AcrR family transcriptional regulator n=1 Tax=Leifsonia sp. 1010 TaxID=2817769 RepID=UPI002862914B|nr:helix-turn-helix domain-containing protein [Leifsonia sp. 1010]MDR6610784.1 AcrR family transcriptional regulator [Leifsonia sp. 1010]